MNEQEVLMMFAASLLSTAKNNVVDGCGHHDPDDVRQEVAEILDEFMDDYRRD